MDRIWTTVNIGGQSCGVNQTFSSSPWGFSELITLFFLFAVKRNMEDKGGTSVSSNPVHCIQAHNGLIHRKKKWVNSVAQNTQAPPRRASPLPCPHTCSYTHMCPHTHQIPLPGMLCHPTKLPRLYSMALSPFSSDFSTYHAWASLF